MKKPKRPDYIEKECFECKDLFQAKRKDIGYTILCSACAKKSAWGSPINKTNRWAK